MKLTLDLSTETSVGLRRLANEQDLDLETAAAIALREVPGCPERIRNQASSFTQCSVPIIATSVPIESIKVRCECSFC
ncbi:hypothetical protein [Tianweitania sediminis]|uniref:Uncharacterized protein n=1 Tax=Tianweitania sediminis TaxID=1502156 RepID=A0A8J7R9B4_9HYPH|nr:hypothetical protein [Tianweitania sediminis]MBP0440652.1 hypothetical protein [Tianweitania sediminis]